MPLVDLGNLGIVDLARTPGEILMEIALAGKRGRAALLTQRERQLAACLAEGLSRKATAERLGLTVGTVKLYFHRLHTRDWTNLQVALAGLSLILQGASLKTAENGRLK